METSVNARHRPGDDTRIRHVTDDDIIDPRHVFALSGGQVIENAHLVSRRNESIHKVRADKTATTRHQISRQ